MALFAVLMCVNFVACSSSDDEPNINREEDGNIKKKLMRLELEGTDVSNKFVYEFSYDNDNRLIQVISNGNKYYFNWIDDKIHAAIRENTSIYDLSNGLITKIVFENNLYTWGFSFNQSKELTEYTIQQRNETSLYKWEDNNIVAFGKEGNEFTSIEYSNKINKGWWYPECELIDMSYYMDENAFLFIAHPNLLGKQCAYLPKKFKGEHNYDFIFNVDKDGYVEKCTIVKANGQTRVYTYTWE